MILTLTKNHDTAQQGGRGRAGVVTSGGRQAGALAESRASGRQEAQERAAGRAVAIAARGRTVASGRTDARYASGEPARPPACLMRVASQRAPARPAVCIPPRFAWGVLYGKHTRKDITNPRRLSIDAMCRVSSYIRPPQAFHKLRGRISPPPCVLTHLFFCNVRTPDFSQLAAYQGIGV